MPMGIFERSSGWWIGMMVISVLGLLLFFVNPNVEFKKRYFRIWIVFSGVAFVAFALGIGFPIVMVIFPILPMAAFVTFLNYKIARICGTCGRYNQKLTSGKLYCRHCGAEIID